MRDVSNRQNLLDSRDIIKRLDELQTERDDLAEALTSAGDALEDFDDDSSADADNDKKAAVKTVTYATDALTAWDTDNGEELTALTALAKEGTDYSSDWPYGGILIRDSYFEDYARELAESIGAINRDTTWPCNCIDWERAAAELQDDYTSINFGGVEYWIH